MVPVLSLNHQDADPDQFAAEFGSSFATYGFAIIDNHGIDPALVDRAWQLTADLFALPSAVKERYCIAGGGGQRGYTRFGTEIAVGSDQHDLKEFWHIGRDLPIDHRFRGHMASNVWPVEIEDFRSVKTDLYAAFDATAKRLLSALALYLGLPATWFDVPIENGNSILRLLHYPPILHAAEGMRAGAHEDINLITLLLGAEEAGLELLGSDGGWLAVDPPRGAMVVNVGDMLQRLTNHRLPSTSHRVVNPPAERRHLPRYSMPFFLHPASDFLISTLPGCVDADHADRYPASITADAYLRERLVEIGLV